MKPSPGTTRSKLLNIKANIYFTNSLNQSMDVIIIVWWKQIYFESQHSPVLARKASNLHEFFFNKKLIENTKSHFDFKLSKQKVTKFLFLWKTISTCDNKDNTYDWSVYNGS